MPGESEINEENESTHLDATTDQPQNESSPEPKEDMSNHPHSLKADRLSRLISEDLKYISDAHNRLEIYKTDVDTQLGKTKVRLEDLKKSLEKATSSSQTVELPGDDKMLKIKKQLHRIEKAVMKVKTQIPSKIKIQKLDRNRGFLRFALGKQMEDDQDADSLRLFGKSIFEESYVNKEFRGRYQGLSPRSRLCLLCFALFPEESDVIKHRTMIYLWMSQGFLIDHKCLEPEDAPSPPDGTANTTGRTTRPAANPTAGNSQPAKDESVVEYYQALEFAREVFDELAKEGFINKIYDKYPFKAHSCRMHPLVRTVVVKFAKEARFIDVDENGLGTEECPLSQRSCIMAKPPEEDYSGMDNEADQENQNQWAEAKKNAVPPGDDSDTQTNKTDKTSGGKKEREATGKENEGEPTGKENEGEATGKENSDSEQRKEVKDIKQEEAGQESDTELLRMKREKMEKIHMVFNTNETLLQFPADDFFMMKNVNILYLGRWQSKVKHHIEVDDAKFLEGLKHLKHIKFLSLQGVSGITRLSDSISELDKMTVFDLRACHGLERIPDEIGNLRSLMHLDLSECYLLDGLPKSLSQLKNLLVLKGFVVPETEDRESCTLEDLVQLGKLRKLCIYTSLKDFPREEEDLPALKKFVSLDKLTIAWGGRVSSKQVDEQQGAEAPKQGEKAPEDDKTRDVKASTATAGQGNQEETRTVPESSAPKEQTNRVFDRATKHFMKKMQNWRRAKEPATNKGLPINLTKLDLKCCPQLVAPGWLKPDELAGLKTLYIRGGSLSDLGQTLDWDVDQKPWNVKTLRLKYLTNMDMDWEDLRDLFPKLEYLEKVHCPKLTFFPCDGKGFWKNPLGVAMRWDRIREEIRKGSFKSS